MPAGLPFEPPPEGGGYFVTRRLSAPPSGAVDFIAPRLYH